jgi:hypothetical protein
MTTKAAPEQLRAGFVVFRALFACFAQVPAP